LNDRLVSLRLQYGNAAYQVARYQHEMELLKTMIDRAAQEEALDACTTQTAPPEIETQPAPLSKELQTRIIESRELRGIRARIARELGISSQQVYRVANGQGKSARVSAALEQAYADLQKAGRP